MPYYFYDPVSYEYRGSMAASGAEGSRPPDNSTLDAPENRPGFAAFRNTNGNSWEYVEDHRGRTAYMKDLSGTLTVETVGVIPDGMTLIPPPPLKDGFAVEWKRKQWGYVEDHRGKVGYVKGEETKITELGPLPAGWSTEPPPPPPPVIPPDTRTPKEKRESAYRSEVDPVAMTINGYRIEAEALIAAGNKQGASTVNAKANALLRDFLAKKEEIRRRFQDEEAVTESEG